MPRLHHSVVFNFVLVGAVILSAKADSPAGLSLPAHKLQVADPTVARQIAAQGGRLVADYGSFQLYDVPSADVQLFGEPETQNRDHYNIITLKSGPLDTTQTEVQALRNTAGAFTGKRLH